MLLKQLAFCDIQMIKPALMYKLFLHNRIGRHHTPVSHAYCKLRQLRAQDLHNPCVLQEYIIHLSYLTTWWQYTSVIVSDKLHAMDNTEAMSKGASAAASAAARGVQGRPLPAVASRPVLARCILGIPLENHTVPGLMPHTKLPS